MRPKCALSETPPGKSHDWTLLDTGSSDFNFVARNDNGFTNGFTSWYVHVSLMS